MKLQRIPLIAALVTLVAHLLGNPHYGFFRDELYFIICGFRPDWGYVDQPPIAPLLAAGSQLFGHSLFLLRAVPALFAAAGAYVTCLLVIELGGGAFAEIVAATAFFFTGVLMSFGMKVGPDMVGLWLWPLAALDVLRIAKGGDPRLWLAAGTVIGVSLESKYSVLFFVVALVAGLLLTPQRRIVWSRWFLAGAGVALAIALPNFIWQVVHGFPILELLRNGQMGKNLMVGPGVYLFQQLIITGLFLSIVWIVGLVALLRNGAARFLGYTYVILILSMIVSHGKHYYPGNVYPILVAAGGVAIEKGTRRLAILRPAVLVAIAALGAIFLPFSMPVLSEGQMIAYQDAVTSGLHLNKSVAATEHHKEAKLPSDWADMHGWPELAATVARVYDSLPSDQRKRAAIVASNYGEAAAIDFFGKPYGLPPALSGHNNYWLWGARGYSGDVVIDVNGDCGAAQHLFRTSRLATRFTSPWIMPYEDDLPIVVCTGIQVPLTTLWPKIKNYI